MKSGLLVIVGPTASGKKAFALQAARLFDGEIVSADSRKVYRCLDIGSAKPSPEDRAAVPHHLIDVVDPGEPFSAGEWVSLASEAVSGIIARGRLPILSGGAGFYIEAFQHGLTGSFVSDPDVRDTLEHEAAAKGSPALFEHLRVTDPQRASELHENDTFRIMRALELYHITGRTFTQLKTDPRIYGGEYDYYFIGITLERQRLYHRIGQRVDAMVEAGLVGEVERILAMGFPRTLTALDTVGYKEFFPYLDGDSSLVECIEQMKRNTRRYAKRQLTWFRARPHITWFDVSDEGELQRAFDSIHSWLSGYDRAVGANDEKS